MNYSDVVSALIGLLAAVNLLFTFGVVRRLREHTEELATLRGRNTRDDNIALPAGTRVDGFTAETVDGHPITLESLGSRPLLGFFSPSCTPCKERLPRFVAYAASRPGGRNGVLAVVSGTPEEASPLVGQLQPVATVVVEADQGPVQRAFAVEGFPAFVLVQDGRVQVSDYELSSITEVDSTAVPAIG
ncbi:TlpA family protein disulfide reductase [Plantactinospora sp. GCM10030261]|uniref:TlpA family protein disulfide reductase n=1 Tax=Plantactinospora sp. GCM10030261 TaxID=3273420 RepID=UPI003607746F